MTEKGSSTSATSISDVPGPAQSRKPSQAEPVWAGPSQAKGDGSAMALGRLSIAQSQSWQLRPGLWNYLANNTSSTWSSLLLLARFRDCRALITPHHESKPSPNSSGKLTHNEGEYIISHLNFYNDWFMYCYNSVAISIWLLLILLHESLLSHDNCMTTMTNFNIPSTDLEARVPTLSPNLSTIDMGSWDHENCPV